MELGEVKTILKEILYFKKAVSDLMVDFYDQCAGRIAELREEKKREEAEEALYQETMETVKNKGYIKRLVSELL